MLSQGSAHSSSSNVSTSSNDICRICHCEADTDNPLLSPCYCAGSLKYVHQSCLREWLAASDTRSCELCKFNFLLQTKIKPLSEWRSLEMHSVERRRVLCGILFHFVAGVCVFWSLFVLIDRATEEVKKGAIAWPFWTKLVVAVVGSTGGAIFMYIQCRQYSQLFSRWKAQNRIILVQNAPEKPLMAPPSPEIFYYKRLVHYSPAPPPPVTVTTESHSCSKMHETTSQRCGTDSNLDLNLEQDQLPGISSTSSLHRSCSVRVENERSKDVEQQKKRDNSSEEEEEQEEPRVERKASRSVDAGRKSPEDKTYDRGTFKSMPNLNANDVIASLVQTEQQNFCQYPHHCSLPPYISLTESLHQRALLRASLYPDMMTSAVQLRPAYQHPVYFPLL